MTLRLCIAMLLVSACSSSAPAPASAPAQTAGAETPPPRFDASSAAALSAWARAELQRRMPQWTIEPGEEELLLRVKQGELDLGVWLGRPFEYCQTGASDCETVARDFVATTVQVANETLHPTPAPPEQLLPAIRSRADVDGYKAGDSIVEPLGADLFVVYMLDGPTSAAVLQRGTLAELKLSEDQAKARALQNLRTQIAAPSALVKSLESNEIGSVGPDLGYYYTSSLLVPHADWAEVAQRFEGKLLVSVPAPDVLLYARDEGFMSVLAFATVTKDAFSKAQRGLSTTVLRWTPQGWVSATDAQ